MPDLGDIVTDAAALRKLFETCLETVYGALHDVKHEAGELGCEDLDKRIAQLEDALGDLEGLV